MVKSRFGTGSVQDEPGIISENKQVSKVTSYVKVFRNPAIKTLWGQPIKVQGGTI